MDFKHVIIALKEGGDKNHVDENVSVHGMPVKIVKTMVVADCSGPPYIKKNHTVWGRGCLGI